MARNSIRALAAVAAVAALLTACGENQECRQGEKQDYPAIEGLAREVMAGVPHDELERSGGCEMTGHPVAGVHVEVSDWDRMAQAVAYLRKQGFDVDRDGNARTPDGQYFISVSGPARSAAGGRIGVFFQLSVR